MTEYECGGALLRYEEELAKCRFFSVNRDAAKERPPYDAVCDVARWTEGICEIRGFKGVVTRGHIQCLIQALLERGYRAAYIERPDGQGLDVVGQRIKGGDFDGWYRLDLKGVAKRLRMQ